MKVVKHFKTKAVYMGRLEQGQDIIDTLENFCAENEVKSGWVQMIGALKKATISYYDQTEHRYYNKKLEGEFEIVSCSGNISIKDNAPFAHLHMVLSDTNYGCIAGHLMPGSTEVFACEFVLHHFEGDEALVRGFDEETGLSLWLY
jgi:uncharacterized protein